jgi:hypothetical protein
MDTEVEDFLASVENDAAPVYESLLSGDIPRKESAERSRFSLFLALMYARTPSMRRMAGEMLGRQMQITNYAYATNEEAFNALLARAEKKGMRTLNESEKERLRNDFIDPTGYIFEIPKEATLPILGSAEKLAPIFFDMHWSVASAGQGFFITSDNPLVKTADPKTWHPIYGDGGFLNKTTEVHFPLSRARLLLMSWNDSVPALGTFDRKTVDRINKSRAWHSERYLYAHIKHKEVLKLAAEFKDVRPTWSTSGFGPKKFAEVKVTRRRKK